MSEYHQFICDPSGPTSEVCAMTPASGADWWYEAFPGSTNDSGVRVNGYTALTNCNVWKALNVLAGDLGQLPIKLFRKQGDRSIEVEGIPEIECLRTEPNPWTLPSVYKETSMWTAALWGNSVSWINRPNPNRIQLVPLVADRVGIELDNELTGDFFYTYRTNAGTQLTFDREDVVHIPGLTTNGVWGMSLLDIARNCIGQGLAIEKHINKSFANSARPLGVLKHPGRLQPEARENIRREWNQVHQGSDNAGKIAVLWEGMEYMATAMTMEHAQVEELRRLDRELVASLFNLPLFKLNSLEHSATRSNLEQQNQEYLQGSLMRWLNRFREEWERKLLSPAMRAQGYYYRWVTEALLRGDTQSRFTAYGVAIQNRIMNPNEARKKEDMEPYAGGDEFGNPNIDPKAKNDAANEGGRPPGSFRKADALIAHQILAVIKAESSHVTRAATDSRNFVKALDKYYDVGGGFWAMVESILLPTVDTLCLVIDGYRWDSESWVAKHAAESKRLLLKLCDQTTRERLAAAIKEEVDTWSARASM